MTDGRKDKGAFPEEALDALFAEARADPQDQALPEALVARILSDAEAVQARQAVPVARPRRSGVRQSGGLQSRLRAVLSAIGGFPAVAGLAAATLAGVWIGIAPPSTVRSGVLEITGVTASEDIFDFYVVDSADAYDFTQVEG